MHHAILAFVFCVTGWALHSPVEFCILPAAFYLGRELAQAEYRYMEAHGINRSAMPFFVWFYPSAWTLKGLLDWVLPLIVCVGVMLCWRY